MESKVFFQLDLETKQEYSSLQLLANHLINLPDFHTAFAQSCRTGNVEISIEQIIKSARLLK
jgi:hypothetical protein